MIGYRSPTFLKVGDLNTANSTKFMIRPYTAILIVPTGVGAEIGGYAGDAIPVARLLAQVCDRLITHPNVLNGASLYWNIPNALYVEGYGLDKFAAGCWGLLRARAREGTHKYSRCKENPACAASVSSASPSTETCPTVAHRSSEIFSRWRRRS